MALLGFLKPQVRSSVVLKVRQPAAAAVVPVLETLVQAPVQSISAIVATPAMVVSPAMVATPAMDVGLEEDEVTWGGVGAKGSNDGAIVRDRGVRSSKGVSDGDRDLVRVSG